MYNIDKVCLNTLFQYFADGDLSNEHRNVHYLFYNFHITANTTLSPHMKITARGVLLTLKKSLY